MKLDRRQLTLGLAGIPFVLGSIAIHYQIKVKMARPGRAGSDQFADLEVGSDSPDFSATDLLGHEVALSQLRGRKAVVLDFWATWCGPCLQAMPALQKLHEDFSERGVEILAVNLGEGPERIQSFLKRNKYTFRVIADQDETIGAQFGVRSIPSQVVINAKGRIEWIRVGYSLRNERDLRQVIEGLTEQDGPQVH